MNKITMQDLTLNEKLDNWIQYTVTKPFNIFGKAPKEVSLSVHKNIIKPENYLEQITAYLKWLSNCQSNLYDYYKNKFADLIEEFNLDVSDWYDTLEVYGVNITLTENGMCCADISCGDNVFQDHILDISFFGYEIESMGLDG